MYAIIALVLKELLALLKDKRSRMVIIVPPILQLLIFGYAASFDLDRLPYAVLDRDGGAGARALLAEMAGSPHFDERYRLRDVAEVARLIDQQEVLMVVQIDPQFERRLQAGETAPVQLLIDGRNSNTAQIVRSYATQVIERFNSAWGARASSVPLAQLEPRSWYNPNLESRWFFIPGVVGILTLVVTMVTTALSVAREREQGTFDQLLVTPMQPLQILLGKALPGLLIGLIEGSLVVTLAVLWFEIPLLGSLGALYATIGVFLLAAVGVGLMISSLVSTLQQALLGAFLFMVPAVILSGFATPIANMPDWVQWLTYINPMRYYLICLRGVFLEATPLTALWPHLWPLMLFATVNLGLAGWLFRHKLY